MKEGECVWESLRGVLEFAAFERWKMMVSKSGNDCGKTTRYRMKWKRVEGMKERESEVMGGCGGDGGMRQDVDSGRKVERPLLWVNRGEVDAKSWNTEFHEVLLSAGVRKNELFCR
jgi:hypothetical protein